MQTGFTGTLPKMEAQDAAGEVCTAAERGDVEAVRRLLHQDSGLLEARISEGNLLRTPLMLAALEGHMEVVTFLVEEGADVNARDADGETPLYMAAGWGHEEVVAFLLSRGADARTSNRHGSTPLHEASCEGHLRIVRLLLHTLGGRGLEALSSFRFNLGREPLRGTVHLDDADEEGRTALWLACHYGRTEVVRALLLAGASHAIPDRSGITPLQAVLENGHDDTMTRCMLKVRYKHT
jgi:ankyrin repeat protein